MDYSNLGTKLLEALFFYFIYRFLLIALLPNRYCRNWLHIIIYRVFNNIAITLNLNSWILRSGKYFTVFNLTTISEHQRLLNDLNIHLYLFVQVPSIKSTRIVKIELEMFARRFKSLLSGLYLDNERSQRTLNLDNHRGDILAIGWDSLDRGCETGRQYAAITRTRNVLVVTFYN